MVSQFVAHTHNTFTQKYVIQKQREPFSEKNNPEVFNLSSILAFLLLFKTVQNPEVPKKPQNLLFNRYFYRFSLFVCLKSKG